MSNQTSQQNSQPITSRLIKQDFRVMDLDPIMRKVISDQIVDLQMKLSWPQFKKLFVETPIYSPLEISSAYWTIVFKQHLDMDFLANLYYYRLGYQECSIIKSKVQMKLVLKFTTSRFIQDYDQWGLLGFQKQISIPRAYSDVVNQGKKSHQVERYISAKYEFWTKQKLHKQMVKFKSQHSVVDSDFSKLFFQKQRQHQLMKIRLNADCQSKHARQQKIRLTQLTGLKFQINTDAKELRKQVDDLIGQKSKPNITEEKDEVGANERNDRKIVIPKDLRHQFESKQKRLQPKHHLNYLHAEQKPQNPRHMQHEKIQECSEVEDQQYQPPSPKRTLTRNIKLEAKSDEQEQSNPFDQSPSKKIKPSVIVVESDEEVNQPERTKEHIKLVQNVIKPPNCEVLRAEKTFKGKRAQFLKQRLLRLSYESLIIMVLSWVNSESIQRMIYATDVFQDWMSRQVAKRLEDEK